MRAALKLKHVSGAVDYVRHLGGDDPVITCNGSVRLSWMCEGRPLAISMSAKSRNDERALQVAKQDIRRECRSAGLLVSA